MPVALLPALDGTLGDRAVSIGGDVVRWSELAARADALGAELDGAPAIAVCGTATLDTLIAVVAGLRRGVPVVPVPADAGPTERGHILRDSGASLVIGAPEWPEVDLPRVPIPAGGPAPSPAPGLAPDIPAIVM